jgi:uncharacterized membrane protein YfhO
MAFALPALIILIGFFTRGVFPIADRNVLTIDLYHQYAPFMAELQDKFRTGGSLFYSWSGGLGTNFYALFAYYLASPLNILIVLFPQAYLTEAILLLVVLKTGLAGACFFLFLRGVYKHNNLFMVAVSCLYALSSYSLAYYWNIMWLDGIFLLPLVMLGLVLLVREGRFWLYAITLGLVIYSNYYIAFFVCAFTVLYFVVCLFQYQALSRPKPFFAAVGRFTVFSLIGAGLSAFLSLPTYFSLQLTSAAGDHMPRTVTHYYDLFDYIGQHFILTPPTIRDGMPNMYAGVALLILVPLYFLVKSIPPRVKFLHLGLLLVLVLSFNINVLNFAWHGMHFPNQLPYRNSFVYIFLILSMVYPVLTRLRECSGKQIGLVSILAAFIVLLSQKLNTETPELQTLYGTLIGLSIYAAVLTLDRIRHMSQRDLAGVFLIVIVAELLVNTLMTLHRIDVTEVMSTRKDYLSGRQVEEIRAQLDWFEQEEDLFYRVEVLPPKTINDPFMYQYRGVSIFASTMQTKPVKMFENLGYHSNGINSYKYEASTLVLDTLWGIKYIIRRSGNQEYQVMQQVLKTDWIEVFKNPYALSLGYVGTPALENWRSAMGNPFKAQNRLVQDLTGMDEEVLRSLSVENGDLDNMTYTGSARNVYSYRKTNADQKAIARVEIENDKDQQVYLYFDSIANRADRGYVMIGDKKIDYNAKRSTIVDLGYVQAGIPIEFNITFDAESPESGRFELYAAALDQTVFEQAVSNLQTRSIWVEKLEDRVVQGRFHAEEEGILMLSMPYDKGWSVRVDDNKVETLALDDGLICFPVSEGEHTFEMRYTPPWFTVGLLISLFALAILIVIGFVSLKYKKRRVMPARIQEQQGIRPITLDKPSVQKPDSEQQEPGDKPDSETGPTS